MGKVLVTELTMDRARKLIFAGPSDGRADDLVASRYDGMQMAATALGMGDARRISVPLQLDGAARALSTTITDGTPTAVGCYNDLIAIAVVAAARRLGPNVPADISVMGVEATDLGQLVSPRLTSVRIDSTVLLPAAVEDLAAFLRGEDPAGIGSATEALSVVDGETT